MRFRFVPVAASCAVFAFAGSVSAARPKLPKPKLPIATWTTTSPLSDTVVSDSLRSGTAYSGGDAGVSKTTNGGVAWSGPIGPVFVNAIAVDQINGNAVYVGTNNGANESTLYRSTDAGASYPFHN